MTAKAFSGSSLWRMLTVLLVAIVFPLLAQAQQTDLETFGKTLKTIEQRMAKRPLKHEPSSNE